jgi:putative sterol carrier protein
VPEVGSDEWIEAFAERAAGVVVDDGVRIVVQQELADSGASWHVVVADGRATVRGGRHPEPDVTITEDRDTATAIGAGRLSAQQAFIDGRLRVRGSLDRLARASAALAALGA